MDVFSDNISILHFVSFIYLCSACRFHQTLADRKKTCSNFEVLNMKKRSKSSTSRVQINNKSFQLLVSTFMVFKTGNQLVIKTTNHIP